VTFVKTLSLKAEDRSSVILGDTGTYLPNFMVSNKELKWITFIFLLYVERNNRMKITQFILMRG
jgi:hypothetical protein